MKFMKFKTWIVKKLLGIDVDRKQKELDAAIRADQDRQRIIDLQIQKIDELTADNQSLRQELDRQMAASDSLYNEMVTYQAENQLYKKLIHSDRSSSKMSVFHSLDRDTSLVMTETPSWMKNDQETPENRQDLA